MKYLFFIVLLFSLSFAHKVNLFVTQEGENIEIYSYFSSGTACKNCRLIIKNEDKIVLEDKLSKDGKYTFKPKYKNIEVTIDAGEGHVAKESLEVANIKHEDIKTHKQKEEHDKYLKIVLGLLIILVFFYLLKRFKK